MMDKCCSQVALLYLVVSALLPIATGCTPTPQPEPATRPLHHSIVDSLREAEAGGKSPEWRVNRYGTRDLHGPFPRPMLPTGADTNDPVAYFRLGDSLLYHEQGVADRALYWALRLDPTMAEAYYERWDQRYHGVIYSYDITDSLRRTGGPTLDERIALDSLRVSALMYNPFLDGALNIPPQILRLREWQADRDARTSGLWAYKQGNYLKAVKKWGEAIRKSPENAAFHVPRAFAWVHLNQSDSAVADLTALIHQLERIQDSTVAPYVSKDFLYYAIGMLRARQDRLPEARAAYEATLAENLGFYMAHVRLSGVALLLNDTTTALNELETATLIRGDDPMVLSFRGSVLDAAGRLDEAEPLLRAAVHADTDYALPYAFLGHVAEQRHDTTRAVSAYREYLARANHTAAERVWVNDHMARLTKAAAPRKPD